jgi:hypothetical protein
VTIKEASLQARFTKAAPRTFMRVPGLQETVEPLAGSVLSLDLRVVPRVPNREGMGKQYNVTPSDFHLVDGQQVIPMYKLVGRRSLMGGSIYTIGMEDAGDKERALMSGMPIDPGTDMELLFLVDPNAGKWDLYFGAHKVGEIPNPDQTSRE